MWSIFFFFFLGHVPLKFILITQKTLLLCSRVYSSAHTHIYIWIGICVRECIWSIIAPWTEQKSYGRRYCIYRLWKMNVDRYVLRTIRTDKWFDLWWHWKILATATLTTTTTSTTTKKRRNSFSADTIARSHSFTHQPLLFPSEKKANNGNGDCFFHFRPTHKHWQNLTSESINSCEWFLAVSMYTSTQTHTVYYGR